MSDYTDSPYETQQNIAPSEKHLEDWIVANPQRFGQLINDDLVPREYWPEDALIIDGEYYLSDFFNQIVARQLPLPSGRPDLICHVEQRLTVVELKKGLITYDVIGQCIRYMHDLTLMYEQIYTDIEYSGDAGKFYRYDRRTHPGISYDHYTKEVSGMVVGCGIQDKNLVFVAEASGIQVVTYKYADGLYWFDVWDTHDGNVDLKKYLPYINGALGNAMRLVMIERAKEEKRMKAVQAGMQS